LYALVSPVLALGLLAVAGLLAARLPRPSLTRPPSLDRALTAGAPLVLLGLVLGPGIELLARPLWRALAPLTAFAIGWIGAALGARFEWRYVRRIPRGTWLLAAAGAGAAFLVVALGAWLLARRVPSLAAVWAPRLPLAGRDLTAPLVGSVLLGAGVGYATDVSPFIVCALAGLVTVNASPRRRELRTTLRAWERPMYAPVLIISGALLALPTVWIIAAVPALQALRIAARWVSTRYARLALPLRDLTPHFGLGTVAQGGTALALAVNYFITYGSGPESPGGGASGMDAGAAVLTTMVLGVALAQLAAPPLMRLAVRAGPAPLTPAPARPELTANAPGD